MKFVIAPPPEGEEWSRGIFPGMGLLHLPVAAKTRCEHLLDHCHAAGADGVAILEGEPDDALFAGHLGKGEKWGLEIARVKRPAPRSDEEALAAAAEFTKGDPDARVIRGAVFPYGGEMVEVDSLAKWFALNFAVLEDPKERTLPGYGSEPGVCIGENVAIMTHALVEKPVALGDNVHVSDGAELSGGAIVGRGSYVEKGCRVRRTVILSHTYVGRNLTFENKVVVGRRVIDPLTGAYADLEEPSLSFRFGSGGPGRLARAARRIARFFGAGKGKAE